MDRGKIELKALVTGGGGFLGQRIVEKLIERGDSVRILGRNKYPHIENLGVETFRGDIQDLPTVLKASKNIDAVFHVASKTGIWGKWKDFFETNVTGTENVIKACQKNGVSRLVYTSSPSVIYGGKDLDNADETIPYPAKYLCPWGPRLNGVVKRPYIDRYSHFPSGLFFRPLL